MKLALTLLLSLFSMTVFACPNLSGEFSNTEFGTYYSISQSNCDLVEFYYDEGLVSAYTDGVERLIAEINVKVEEGSVLANIKIFASYVFKNERLITNQKVVTTYTSDGKVEEDKTYAETFLNGDNNLVNIYHDASGSFESIDERVK